MFKIYNKEKQELSWRLWVVLLIEFIGTFILVFMIIAPKSLGWSTDDHDNQVGAIMYDIFFATFIQIAIYVSLLILILIFLLRHISINLNPAVTLALVASGHHKLSKALPMIVFQFAGGIAASILAFQLIDIVGTEAVQTKFSEGIYSIDTLSPRFAMPMLIEIITGNESSIGLAAWGSKQNAGGPSGTEWILAILVFLIEFLFTFALLASIIFGKDKISHNTRPFIIFFTLVVILSIGAMTNNVALNPVRLLSPAIVSHVIGNLSQTPWGEHEYMQYQMIYLAGEIAAVALIFFIESSGEQKEVVSIKAHKIVIPADSFPVETSEFSGLELVKRVKKTWVENGNHDLSKMDKKELISMAKKYKIPINKTDSRNDIENYITAYLIFGINSK